MTNLLKKYFLFVAEKPLQRAFTIAVGLFIALSIARVFISGVPAFSFSADQVFQFSLVFFAVLTAVNLIVPAIFITYFFPSSQRLVLIRDPGEQESFIYQRPLWGKLSYAEIIFPEGWNLQEAVQKQIFDLGIIFPISSRHLAFLNLRNTLVLDGTFQACSLQELIRQQGPNQENDRKFYFKKCLCEIVSRHFSDRRELIKEDLVKWQNKAMTTRELEKRWINPDIIFQGIFNNIEDWGIKLLTPEIKQTRGRQK